MTRTLLRLMLLALLPACGLAEDGRGSLISREVICDGSAIDEQGFVPIGGIEQWVTISGDNCANPVVLFLHGGPGNTLSPFATSIYGHWRNEFTLVQWDQRGAGRSFGRNPQTADATLSIEQMSGDGIELAEHLRQRLGVRKLILLGGSWGSVLGVHMAKARPDLFHAYIGVGQLVKHPDNQQASYAAVVERARAAGDTETLDALLALGAPPWTNPRHPGVLRRATRRYENASTDAAPSTWWAPSAEYTTAADEQHYSDGEDHSYLQFVGLHGDGMLSTVDLPALGTTFGLPVYLIHGEQDLVTVPAIARRYFDTIDAPHKEFITLPRSGHDPNAAMIEAEHRVVQRIAATLSAE